MATENCIYRVGLVGCGRIGSEWDPIPPVPLTHAGAFVAHPRAMLVAGANRGRERLEAFGRKWGVSALYQDYRQMLAREELDIVCVATHPELHHEQVLTAAKAGVKAILCEKPMALSLDEADEMIQACEGSGTLLAINHQRRWDPTVLKAKELVQSGSIGQLLTVVGHSQGIKPRPDWRAENEGPLLHDATHLFDLFRMFAGDPEWVIGTAVRRQRPFRVEDESLSILKFKSDVSGIAVVNELTTFSRFECELIGSHGKIILDMQNGRLWGLKRSPHMDRGKEENHGIEWWDLDPRPFPPVSQNTAIQQAADDLIKCLDTGQVPRSTGQDGRAALEIIMAIYESQRRGNAKVLCPLPRGPSSLHLMREEGYF